MTAERLRIAISSFGGENNDPSMEIGTVSGVINAPIYDWLLWNNPDGTLAPGVAAKWELAADGKSWTYTLRSDLRFHNGTPVTASDVKFSIERVLRPQATAAFASLWRTNVDAIEAVSATVAKVNTKQPWPLMPYVATLREGTEGGVASASYFAQVGESKYRQEPVGSGPWKMTRHDVGIRFIYEALSGHPYRATPAYKTLELVLAPEESTRVAMLKTNQADIIEIGPDSVPTVTAANLQVFQIENVFTGATLFFGWGDERLASMPMNKKQVREALGIAFDKKTIIDTVLGGLATIPTRSTINVSGVLGYDPSWQPDPYDPTQAKRLLADAGYPRGFSIKFYTYPLPGAPWLPRAAEALAGYWADIGVTTEIVPSDFGTIAAAYRRRPQPDFLIGNFATIRAPVQTTGLSLYDAYYKSNGTLIQIKDPEMDKLLAEANNTLSEERRVQVIRQIVNRAHDEWVNYPIATTGSLYGVSRSIGSWTPVRSGFLGMALETVKPRR